MSLPWMASPTAPATDLALVVEGLGAGYGQAPVLDGLNLTLARGEVLGLLGRNGSGRSTLVKVLTGQLPYQGRVALFGHSIQDWTSHQIARHGLAVVAQSRDVFTRLTVLQNLQLGQRDKAVAWAFKAGPYAEAAGLWTMERLLAVFPALAQRLHTLAGALSGGEQQMLSMARALLGQPRLLVVDEPTEGLSPNMVQAVSNCLQAVAQQGCAILLIEQKMPLVMALAHRVGLMGQGQMQYLGCAASLKARSDLIAQWLEAGPPTP